MRREPATVATGEPIEVAKAAAGGGKVGATGEPEAAAEAPAEGGKVGATGEPIEVAEAPAEGGKVGATGEPEAAAEAAEWTTPSTGRAPGNSRVTVQKLFWRSMGTGISSSAWPAGMTARKSQTGGQSSPWEMITGSKGPAMSGAWLPDSPDEQTADETEDWPADETEYGQEGWRERHTARTSTSETGTLR